MGDSGDSFAKQNNESASASVSTPESRSRFDVQSETETQPEDRCAATNILSAQLCCMLGTSPCFFCCGACCPDMKESTTTRLMYVLMFVFTIALMLICLIGEIPIWLASKIPWVNSTCIEYLGTGSSCDGLFGNYVAVYKVCAGQLSLHLIMIVITICGTSSTIFPGVIHNGLWFWKWALMIGVVIMLFLFVHSTSNPLWSTMRIFGVIGGCLFIMVNTFFMCEAAISTNGKLLEKAKKNPKWYLPIWLLTMVLLGLTCGICYVLLRFYSICYENTLFSVANMVGCALLLVLTLIAGVGKGSKNADLLQGSVIISFILYQTWSAIHSRPTGSFNAALLEKFVHQSYSTTPTSTVYTEAYNHTSSSINTTTSADDVQECKVDFGFGGGGNSAWASKLRYVGLAYYLFTAIYKSVDHTKKQAKTVQRYIINGKQSTTDVGPDVRVSVLPNSERFVCSILFVMMTLTNWFDPGTDIELSDWQPNWAAHWVEILTSWLVMLVYICTLLLPLHCQDNPYYKKLSQHVPQTLSRLPSLNVKQPRLYYDEQGDLVTNLASYEGVLCVYDSQDNLKPVTLVKPLKPYIDMESAPTLAQRLHDNTSQVSYPVGQMGNGKQMSTLSTQPELWQLQDLEAHDKFDEGSLLTARKYKSARAVVKNKRSGQPMSIMSMAPTASSASYMASASSFAGGNILPIEESMTFEPISSNVTTAPNNIVDYRQARRSPPNHQVFDGSRSVPAQYAVTQRPDLGRYIRSADAVTKRS